MMMVKQSIRYGFEIVTVSAVVITVLVWLARDHIASIYVNDPSVIQLTTELIGLVALYHFFDSMQTLSFFILRSLKTVFIPFVIYSCLLWGLGLGGGYVLAYKFELIYALSPSAFWLSSSAALFFVSFFLILLLRFRLIQISTQT